MAVRPGAEVPKSSRMTATQLSAAQRFDRFIKPDSKITASRIDAQGKNRGRLETDAAKVLDALHGTKVEVMFDVAEGIAPISFDSARNVVEKTLDVAVVKETATPKQSTSAKRTLDRNSSNLQFKTELQNSVMAQVRDYARSFTDVGKARPVPKPIELPEASPSGVPQADVPRPPMVDASSLVMATQTPPPPPVLTEETPTEGTSVASTESRTVDAPEGSGGSTETQAPVQTEAANSQPSRVVPLASSDILARLRVETRERIPKAVSDLKDALNSIGVTSRRHVDSSSLPDTQRSTYFKALHTLHDIAERQDTLDGKTEVWDAVQDMETGLEVEAARAAELAPPASPQTLNVDQTQSLLEAMDVPGSYPTFILSGYDPSQDLAVEVTKENLMESLDALADVPNSTFSALKDATFNGDSILNNVKRDLSHSFEGQESMTLRPSQLKAKIMASISKNPVSFSRDSLVELKQTLDTDRREFGSPVGYNSGRSFEPQLSIQPEDFKHVLDLTDQTAEGARYYPVSEQVMSLSQLVDEFNSMAMIPLPDPEDVPEDVAPVPVIHQNPDGTIDDGVVVTPLPTSSIGVDSDPVGYSGQGNSGGTTLGKEVDKKEVKSAGPVELQDPQPMTARLKPTQVHRAGLMWVPTSGPIGHVWGWLVRGLGGNSGAGQTTYGDIKSFKNADTMIKMTLPEERIGGDVRELSISTKDIMDAMGSDKQMTRSAAARVRTLVARELGNTHLKSESGLAEEPFNGMISGPNTSHLFDVVASDPKLKLNGKPVAKDDIPVRVALAIEAGLGYALNPIEDTTMSFRSPMYADAGVRMRLSIGPKM